MIHANMSCCTHHCPKSQTPFADNFPYFLFFTYFYKKGSHWGKWDTILFHIEWKSGGTIQKLFPFCLHSIQTKGVRDLGLFIIIRLHHFLHQLSQVIGRPNFISEIRTNLFQNFDQCFYHPQMILITAVCPHL